MSPRPKADRIGKRAEFAAVARRVFARRGVANTAIGHIMKAAGIAQGTCYLYFDSKDDIVSEVVRHMVDGPQGVTASVFAVRDTHTAARFILSGLQSVERARRQAKCRPRSRTSSNWRCAYSGYTAEHE